jgi:hypothetical protein
MIQEKKTIFVEKEERKKIRLKKVKDFLPAMFQIPNSQNRIKIKRPMTVVECWDNGMG